MKICLDNVRTWKVINLLDLLVDVSFQKETVPSCGKQQ
jgi:hypothetical protein